MILRLVYSSGRRVNFDWSKEFIGDIFRFPERVSTSKWTSTSFKKDPTTQLWHEIDSPAAPTVNKT